jgi:hypothetical protein
VTRATKETIAGKRYLDLQREARRTGRPTDELIQLYALECFLDRLVHSNFALDPVQFDIFLAVRAIQPLERLIELSAVGVCLCYLVCRVVQRERAFCRPRAKLAAIRSWILRTSPALRTLPSTI